jgi:hypothetical protein
LTRPIKDWVTQGGQDDSQTDGQEKRLKDPEDKIENDQKEN